MWKSSSSRTTRAFGYSYSDVPDDRLSGSALSSAVVQRVNCLYRGICSLSRRQIGPSSFGLNSTTNSPNATNGTESYQYFANVQVSQAALNGSFIVHFYLGTPEANSTANLGVADNLVGSTGIFASPQLPNTGNARLINDTIAAAPTVNGTVPLTSALVDSNLTSLAPEAAIPYLRDHLQWRVQQSSNATVNPNDAKLQAGGLEISVSARTVEQPARLDQFPTYGPLQTYANVTEGKPGGLDAGASNSTSATPIRRRMAAMKK